MKGLADYFFMPVFGLMFVLYLIIGFAITPWGFVVSGFALLAVVFKYIAIRNYNKNG